MARQVGPENVVGRDKLIERIWGSLERGSVIFTAERRIGKTTVMKKMVAEPTVGTSIVYIDLEKVDSPERFVEVLLSVIKGLLSPKGTVVSWLAARGKTRCIPRPSALRWSKIKTLSRRTNHGDG